MTDVAVDGGAVQAYESCRPSKKGDDSEVGVLGTSWGGPMTSRGRRKAIGLLAASMMMMMAGSADGARAGGELRVRYVANGTSASTLYDTVEDRAAASSDSDWSIDGYEFSAVGTDFRLTVDDAVATPGTRIPVVVVVHGAGGTVTRRALCVTDGGSVKILVAGSGDLVSVNVHGRTSVLWGQCGGGAGTTGTLTIVP